MTIDQFPIGSLIRYYGPVRMRALWLIAPFTGSHEDPSLPATSVALNGFALRGKSDQWDWPELDDVIEALGLPQDATVVTSQPSTLPQFPPQWPPASPE